MSNDLAPQQLSIPNNQTSQLEPKLCSSMRMGLMELGTSSLQQMSMSNMGVGPAGSGYDGSASQQMSMSNMEIGLLQPISNNMGSQTLPVSNQQTGHMDSQTYNMVSQQYFLPSRQLEELGTLSNNVSSQQLPLLNKRKATMEPTAMHKSSVPNKRVAQAEHRPWLQQITAPDKRFVQQVQFIPNSPGSQHLLASNKTAVQKESVVSKSGPQKQSMLKGQNALMQSTAKAKTEQFGSVRAKMRENLAAALSLVSQDKSPNAEKSSQNAAATCLGKMSVNAQPDGSAPTASDVVEAVSAEAKESLPSKEGSSAIYPGGNRATQGNFANGNTSVDMQAGKCNRHDFQYGNLLQDDVASFSDNFFVRDELLQGNGLSWVLEPDTGVAEKMEILATEKQELRNEKMGVDGDRGEQPADQSPQILASKIEAELFKLFGGVNKKYKERGRSLLFNLKDRNNPELRERVMSGEILPERLCSMTAEELASKELSQWRMAKAEEMAQMVVLPYTEDIRRLVKKTHKGEFQVEVEQTDTTTVDVSVGVSSLNQNSAKVKEEATSSPSKTPGMEEESNAATAEKKSHLETQEDACTITVPSSEGTDLMQGLMVDNELKDTEFLPPIVSLDEFMESLTAEPPFEDLPRDGEKSTPISDKDNTEFGSGVESPVQTSHDPPDSTHARHDNFNITDTKPDTDMKRSDSPAKSEPTTSVVASKGELVWDGLLQLNISVMASVIGIFKSGEKASSKDWPNLLEIKGRVKLNAFEKYLQELPMSRTRAVMILHFVGKEASPKGDLRNLSEVAESYVSDGRVGIAEPAPGVELYFCPPHARTIELLGKIHPKDQLDALSAINNGLIGVLVWKKPQLTSTISPNSTSHHKHSSKKHLSSRKHQDKDNMNATITSKPSMTQGRPTSYSQPPPEDDEDDEVPPGFGPPASRDDDDLPEFNFSGDSDQNTSRGPLVAPFHPQVQTSIRPVDQIRELIHKYGQPHVKPGIGVSTQSWNDDDDDIPEWQPQAQPPVHSSYQRAHVVNQQHQHVGMMQSHQQYRHPAVNLQPQMNVMQAQQQNSWTHGTYMVQTSQTGGVQYYGSVGSSGAGQQGVAWRQDSPKSRGL